MPELGAIFMAVYFGTCAWLLIRVIREAERPDWW